MPRSAKKKFELEKMIMTAILVALTVVIVYTFPKIKLPFWSGTLAFHVPQIMAMFISPISAAAVSVAAGISFAMAVDPIVGARAASQIVFALVGYFLLKKGMNIYLTLALVAPIHAAMECLVVLIFAPKVDITMIFVTTGLFTLIHHFIDCAIAIPALKAINLTRMLPLVGMKNNS